MKVKTYQDLWDAANTVLKTTALKYIKMREVLIQPMLRS